MPLSDERIREIIAEVEAAQVLQRLSACACCGKPLGAYYPMIETPIRAAVPTECADCRENFR